MRKYVSLLLIAFMGAPLVLGGCGRSVSDTLATEAQMEVQTGIQAEVQAGAQTISQNDEEASQDRTPESVSDTVSSSEPGSGDELSTGFDEGKPTYQIVIRVGFLKGPTFMGPVSLMDKTSRGETSNVYEFTMIGKADKLVGKIVNDDLDIALLSANVVSVLYAKTWGNITALDINTLDTPYAVASNDPTSFMVDLKGCTTYTAGKGITFEYIMNYLLKENDPSTSDVGLQFKSEVTEVASLLKRDSGVIGVLPQPFATAACIQNPDLKTVPDLTESWNMLNKDIGNMPVTEVTLVRSDFLRENRSPVADFIKDHETSILFATEHAEGVSRLTVRQGIAEKAPIAQKTLSYCNIVCLAGQEVEDVSSDYLSILHERDPKPIGGQVPGDDFYHMS